jgi:hypothetical protein
MEIPREALECVVFLGLMPEDENHPVHLAGTGFFVGIPQEPPGTGGWIYLITAKHIAANLSHPFLIRANVEGGGGAFVEWSAPAEWITHEDPFVDVAAIPWAPTRPIDFEYVATPFFVTAPDDLRVGQEIFATGLFWYAAGDQRNEPIVRTGHVAMLPGGEVRTGLGRIRAYLAELTSIAGLSGSPVFARDAEGTVLLAGLVHGHWDAPLAPGEPPVNTGIAIVIPAEQILEVLNQEPVVRARLENPPAAAIEPPDTVDPQVPLPAQAAPVPRPT